MRRVVYHGSIVEIVSPMVDVGRENLDFGKGFYVTAFVLKQKPGQE